MVYNWKAIITILKTSVSMAENKMLKIVGASTPPFLIPFVTRSGSEYSSSFWTRASMQSWNCPTMIMNRAGQPNCVIFFQSPSRLTVSNALEGVECFGRVDIGYVEINILFLAFLLEMPCCKAKNLLFFCPF